MEKKRRARINDSLEELKEILLKNTVAITYGQRPTKLEKADILEMTVRYLNTLHKRLATQRTFANSNRDCGVSSTTTSVESTRKPFGVAHSFSLDRGGGQFHRRTVPVKKEPNDDKENCVPNAISMRTKSKPKTFTSSAKSAFTAIHPNTQQKVRQNTVVDADDPWRPWWTSLYESNVNSVMR